jgi:plastocyanin
MRAGLCVLCVIALSACAGGAMQSQPGVPPVTASTQRSTESVQTFTPTNWNVQTGASNYNFAVQDLDFYPKSITINAGDSITYRIASGAGGDAHTVSFVPPGMPIPNPGDPHDLNPAGGTTIDGTKFVNSGILFGGQTFTLHFTKAGTYNILCLFHEPAMESTVVVHNAGTAYPHNAQYYLQIGAQDEWEDFFDGRRSIAQFPFKTDGTTFAAGIDPGLVHFPPPDSTVLRFLNSPNFSALSNAGNITIKVGTVLTWVNETSNEPHTVTFAIAGHDVPSLPPDPAINVVPAPGITTYDGTKVVNSGTFLGGQKFQLKFTKAGKFSYACLYHDNSLMDGVVTVTP